MKNYPKKSIFTRVLLELIIKFMLFNMYIFKLKKQHIDKNYELIRFSGEISDEFQNTTIYKKFFQVNPGNENQLLLELK